MTYVHVLILYPTYDTEAEVVGVFTTRKEAQKWLGYEDDWGGELVIKRMKLDCVTMLWR